MKNLKLPLIGIMFVISIVSTPLFAEPGSYFPHYLYKVELNGNTSWVFGTMHVTNVEVQDFQFLSGVLGSVKSAMLELGTEVEENKSIGETAYDLGGFESKPILPKLLDKKPYERFIKFFNVHAPEDKLLPQIYIRSKPGVAFYVLFRMMMAVPTKQTESTEVTSPSTPTEVLDNKISNRVRELNIPIIGLDTTESRIKYFIKTVDAKFLNRFINDNLSHDGKAVSLSYFDPSQLSEENRSELLNGTNQYLNGRAHLDDSSTELSNMLLRRDSAWFPTILSELKSHPTLVAVGLSHVIRKDGILDYLKSKGAKITPATQLFSQGCQLLFN